MLLLVAVNFIDGYKILVLLPFPGPSHFLMFKVFIKELIARGHEVTSISAFPFDEKLSNYTEVLIDPPWAIGEHCELKIYGKSQIFCININFSVSQSKIYDLRFNNDLENLYSYWWLGLGSTEHALQSKAVKKFILNDDTKFDLVLSEQFYQESLLMFAHKYKVPIVTISESLELRFSFHLQLLFFFQILMASTTLWIVR